MIKDNMKQNAFIPITVLYMNRNTKMLKIRQFGVNYSGVVTTYAKNENAAISWQKTAL